MMRVVPCWYTVKVKMVARSVDCVVNKKKREKENSEQRRRRLERSQRERKRTVELASAPGRPDAG